METQETVIQAAPVTLSQTDQEEIITFVKNAWDRGKKDRKEYEDHWKDCDGAYHCKMEPITSPELDWMSNECLPWAYDAAESWYAHIHSTTIPKRDQIFTISGRTVEDHPGADVMQKYIEYRFERNKFPQQLAKAYQSLRNKNHACLKVYWRTDKTIEYPWVQEPVMAELPHPETGELMPVQIGTRQVRRPQETTTFNNVWIDVIDLDNFVMYPIRGDNIAKSTQIHETYVFYEDLLERAKLTNYFNLDQIKQSDERSGASPNKPGETDTLKEAPKGLNIKEAWIPRVVINGQTFRNYVATIVNDKTLIRFQPYPPGCPKSPFVFMALRPDGDCFYGYGINSKGLGILKKANDVFNAYIDEGNLHRHGAHKYYDDGTFNPDNIIRRPGAMIKLSKEGVQDNLIPLVEDSNKTQIALQDLEALKNEFEEVTVPKVVKGLIDVERDPTATEVNQAQNNSFGKMHIDAFNINDWLILPTMELTYQAIYDRAQFDEDVINEMMLITEPHDQQGNPIGQLPLLPLPEVDIKIVGYQNTVRKQEQLGAMAQALPQFAQSPGGKYLIWDNLMEDAFKLMDLDTDRYIMDDQQKQQADQNEQAQAQQKQDLLIQQQVTQFQLQKEKQDQDFQVKLEELRLKELEITLRFQQQAQTQKNQSKGKKTND